MPRSARAARASLCRRQTSRGNGRAAVSRRGGDCRALARLPRRGPPGANEASLLPTE